METKRRHVRGPVVVGAFVLLATAGVVGGYLSLRDYPKPSDIVDIVNRDGDSAVIIRSVNGPDERSFISLFTRQRGERWGAMLPKYRVRSDARPALAATADVVFARSDASGQWAFFAFDAKQGQKLGRIEPFETRASGPGRGLARVGSLADGGMAFEFGGDDGEWAVILAFDLRSGTLSWQAELGAITIARAWLRGRQLIVTSDAELRILSRQTGAEIRRIAIRGLPCVTPDAIYYNPRDERERGVMTLSLADDVASPRALDIGAFQMAGLCANRAEQLILAGRDARGPAVLALDQWASAAPGTASVRWRVPVPGGFHLDEVALQTPDRVPLSGAVGVFVPVLSDGRVIMLDVATGRVAWRSGNPAATRGARLMSVAGELYMYRPDGDVLAVFDNQTGRLHATRSLDGFGPVWPRHIAGGTVWLARARTFAVLDARTLMPIKSAGTDEVGNDIRANFAEQLAIEMDPNGL